MPIFFSRVEALWNGLKAGQAKTRTRITISRDHIDNGAQLGERFEAGQHYFQIIVNEMFLAKERQWFAYYDPMTFVASSYIYDKQLETLPLVVGPALLKQFGQQVPRGMIFQNTPVSGLHPYQGGMLTLITILNRLQTQNNADMLLNVVESISGAIDPSTAFTTYLKIAKTVVDGVETLLGLQETIPVLGYRLTVNPDIGQTLEPTYFVLIDADGQQIDRNKFWVRDSSLCYGNQLATAQPYRDNDFILFSIAQGKERNDERMLPFYPLWESTQDLASRPGDHFWEEAKAQFNTLKRELLNSPDLTQPDSKRLRDRYFEELKKRRQDTLNEGLLGPSELSDAEAEMQQMTAELDKLS